MTTAARPERPKQQKRKVRIGLARDRAFHFYYHDNLDALRDAGAELVPFSPIDDPELPPQLDALWLGGGYPELHAEALGHNDSLCQSVRDFARSGRLIYAECGGLIYLSRGVELPDATRHPLLGVLPSWVRLHARRRALGYVEVEQRTDGPWGARGETLRGHVFHYSDLVQTPEGWQRSYTLRRRRDGAESLEGYRCANTLASYAHLHFAAHPSLADAFVRAAARKTP